MLIGWSPGNQVREMLAMGRGDQWSGGCRTCFGDRPGILHVASHYPVRLSGKISSPCATLQTRGPLWGHALRASHWRGNKQGCRPQEVAQSQLCSHLLMALSVFRRKESLPFCKFPETQYLHNTHLFITLRRDFGAWMPKCYLIFCEVF